jgi:hypothetical protein
MTNDRHGESCARDVGARVDESDTRVACSDAASIEQPASTAASASPSCANGATTHESRGNAARSERARRVRAAAAADDDQTLTNDWDLYQRRLLRAFFREAGSLAARYRVSGADLVAHVRDLSEPRLERGLLLKPVACVGDLAVATACRLGRANAWNELWIFAEPSLTRAAFSRLPETLALTWTRRYWTQLQRTTRIEGVGLARYDGSRPIRLWMVEELMGTLEAERAAGRITIRREQLGRPAPLRLVGQQLA